MFYRIKKVWAWGSAILARDFIRLKSDIESFIAKARKNKLPGVECLKTSLIISIILGKVIPFSLRHSDIYNQPTHSLGGRKKEKLL